MNAPEWLEEKHEAAFINIRQQLDDLPNIDFFGTPIKDDDDVLIFEDDYVVAENLPAYCEFKYGAKWTIKKTYRWER